MQHKKQLVLTFSIALASFLTLVGSETFAQQNPQSAFGGQTHTERGSRSVDPNGIVVDDNNRCPGIDFTTIQAAVNASPAGSTIQVCPGVYREQVRITKRLTIVGVEHENQNQARIEPVGATANTTSLFDGSAIAAIVLVDNTSRVTLENLTVSGASNALNACSPTLIGVFYRNSSGTIEGAAIRNIVANTVGCQNALGIFAQSGGNAGRTNLTVLGSSVHDYDKTGIQANEAGTTLTAIGNAVTGRGSVSDTAQNGIQIAFGASGRIEENSIANHVYAACVSATNCPAAATNVIVFDANDVRVRGNHTGKSQVNIYLEGDRGDVFSNTVFDSDVFDGIVLVGNRNDAANNRIFNSDRAGITIEGNQNRVLANFINEAEIGVFETGTSSNNIVFFNRFLNTGLTRSSDDDASRNARTNGGDAATVNPSRF